MRSTHARLGLGAIAAIGLAQCVGPTAIEVVVSTDVPCASVQEVAIAVGAPGDDSNEAIAHTASCAADGGIGTLVVTPSGGFDDVVGIRAMLGVGTSALDCAAPNFTGCIVARRTLRYTPHTELVLPIALDQSCLDVACDPNSTCVNGACVDAGVGPCVDGICGVADAGAPDAPSGADGGDAGDGGACAVSGAVVVTDAILYKAQPHIARTNTGWAVEYEDQPQNQPRLIKVVDVTAGFTVKAPLQIGSNQPNLPVGGFGSDGTHYAYTHMPSTGQIEAVTVPVGGGTPVMVSTSGIGLSQLGLVWDGSGRYFFLGQVAPGNVATGTFDPSVPSVGLEGIDIVAGQNLAFSASNGTYFASYLDGNGGCRIARCTSISPLVCGVRIDVPSCTAAQAASFGGGTLVAYRNSGGSAVVFDAANPGSTDTLSTMDATGPILLVSPKGFRLIFSQNGDIVGWSLGDVSMSNVSNDKPVPSSGGPAPRFFDAVADATGTGYAITWYEDMTQKIMFQHFCP